MHFFLTIQFSKGISTLKEKKGSHLEGVSPHDSHTYNILPTMILDIPGTHYILSVSMSQRALDLKLYKI